MMKRQWYICALLFIAPAIYGMVDNRFLVPPLFQKPFLIRTREYHNHLIVQPFAMTARNAFGRFAGVDGEQGLFEIYGKYDQNQVDIALERSGRINGSLFRSDWQGFIGGIPWNMDGHFDVYGLGFHYFYELNNYFGIGLIANVMHASSRMEMIKDPFNNNRAFTAPGDERELFLIKEEMNQLLDLCPAVWKKNAVGDIDLYIKLGYSRDYFLKMRRFDADIRLGVYAPAAPPRDIFNPASIPLGGDRHWGIYVGLEYNFDIQEDIQTGMSIQFIKRFGKTMCERMPRACEPQNFGAVVGPAYVDPGLTIGLFPYFAFKDVRDGLGFLLAYALAFHDEDNWRAVGSSRAFKPNTRSIENHSEWCSEHVTLGVFYDCAYYYEKRDHEPIVSFTWDIPVDWIVAKRAFRTHGISFLIETQF